MSDPLEQLLAHTQGRTRLRRHHRTPAGRVSLRDVRRGDAEAVHQLLLTVVDEGHGFVATAAELGADWSPTAHRLARIEAGHGVGLTAWLEHRCVGAALGVVPALHRLRHVARVEVFLAREVRGAGLGRCLMDALVAAAEEHPELDKLSLAAFADNTAALALYRSVGFVEEGRRIAEYKDHDGVYRDDVLLSRRV